MSISHTSAAATPTIRGAVAGDLARVLELLETSGLPTAGVAESLPDFLVAERDGAIVGVVGVESCCDRYALLRSTAVAPEWRSRGLGRQLVGRAIAKAEAYGIHALYLLTTTAEHYFPSFGFVQVDRDAVPAAIKATEEFTSACPATATVMCLPLRK